MPISCHFWDCKALLVTSSHVSSTIASTQPLPFLPFTEFLWTMEVGPSLLLARWRETHCWDICMILPTPQPSLYDHWRHFSFQSTNIYSSSGAVLALTCYINWCFTYLLTEKFDILMQKCKKNFKLTLFDFFNLPQIFTQTRTCSSKQSTEYQTIKFTIT